MRRGIGFAPGVDEQQFELVIAAAPPGAGERWASYHLNLTTGEVYLETTSGVDAPPWWELPLIVRTRVWETERERKR